MNVEEGMLPLTFRTHGAAVWKDGKLLIELLKQILPRGKKGLAEAQIPQCLILDAKDMHELLVVINFWLHLDKDGKARAREQLKRVYSRYASSNERMAPNAPVVGACDSHERLRDRAGRSNAAKAAKQPKSRNHQSEIENPRHLMDKPMRAKFGSLEKELYEMLKMSEHNLNNMFEVGLVLKRNVATPNLRGPTPLLDIVLPFSKTLVVARNETTLRNIFGDSHVDALEEDNHATLWYFDEQPDTYTDSRKKKRTRDKIQTSEETRQVTEHSESTVSPDDF